MENFRIIFNCKCGVTRAFDYQRKNVRILGEIVVRFYRMNGEDEVYSQQDAICSCGKKVKATFVSGTYSENHKCDARCLNAKGRDCTCSCGGENHGKSFLI